MDQIVDRPGLDQPDDRRPARKGLQRREQPRDRRLLPRQRTALIGQHRLDQRDARLRRGDVGLRLLDIGDDRRLFGTRPDGGIGF